MKDSPESWWPPIPADEVTIVYDFHIFAKNTQIPKYASSMGT